MKVSDLYEMHGEALELELLAGRESCARPIPAPLVDRPGLPLAGHLKGYSPKKILVFGPEEIVYLKELTPAQRLERLQAILLSQVIAVVVAGRLTPLPEIVELCTNREIPLFRSKLTPSVLQTRLMVVLLEESTPTQCCHGSFVEVFGMGLLIQGDSSVGKSEAALGLIKRGHRLIADDMIKFRKRDRGLLEGSGSPVTRHHMEVRGIGIINIAHLYGADCVIEKKSLDIVVKLEVWDDSHFYDRNGLEEERVHLLGMEIPHYLLPLKPGRDVVLLLETIALNHRLKMAGFHAAQDLDHQLKAAMEEKQNRQSWVKTV